MEKLSSYYHHIDNGGIMVNIDHSEDVGGRIEMSGQYFGYPSVKSSIEGHHINSETLEKIGLSFIAASQKMKLIEAKRRQG